MLMLHYKPSLENLYHQRAQMQVLNKIIRGISHNAESFCKPQTKQLRMTPHRPTCAMSPITVGHKLDDFTEKLVSENIELKEENEVLKAQIAALQEKCSGQVFDSVCNLSAESFASSTSGDRSQNPSTGESVSRSNFQSNTTLTTEEINHFNKFPKILKEFYEQMKTGKFSSEMYSKCNSTKVYLQSVSLYLSTCKTLLVELMNSLRITKESPRHGYITMCVVKDLD